MDIKEVAEEESDGTDQAVADATDGVNLDGDSRRLAGEELRGNLKEEPIVPRGVLAADSIDFGAKLDGGVDPGDSVRLHPPQVPRGQFDALRRD